MVAILEKGEFYSDFYPMVDFIAASPLRYALTVKPTIFVSHIRQFWSTARIETTDEGTHILATVHGIQRTVSESSLRRNLKLRDEDGIVSIPDTELFENLTLMGQYSRRARIVQSFALLTVAQEEEIVRLKERVQVLEDREGVAAKQSGADAPIKERSINEGEITAERISNDSEEIARVLTSMDAATVLAVGIDVPTGSGFIPTAGPPATVISTGSEVGPTASPIVTRRKGKEVLVESDTPKKKKLQEQIDAQVARELEEQQEKKDIRMNEQIARDAEVVRIHAEEELQGMIDSLDKSNETIAKIVPLFDTMLVHQGEGSSTPTEPHHTPFPEDRATIAKSSTLPYDSAPRVTSPAADEDSMQQHISELNSLCTSLQRQYSELMSKFQAQEEEIGRLKEQGQVLEDRETVATKQSREDAPIKGKSNNEGEAAAERISNDSKDIARVLTSMDAATVLAGETNVPTGSGFIPTAGPPATVISTGSEVGPTASPIITRRKGKEVMVESDTPKKKKLQEQIDAQEIARVLTSIDAATVLAGGYDVPTGSGFIPTIGPPTTVISTGSKVGPTASPIATRRKGKEVMVESDTPKKKRLQEQIDAQVARELEEQQEKEDMRMNKQIARDAEVARIHAEEELQGIINSLDKSNETIAKYLQEYQDFASELPLEKRIELISDLVKYQDNYLRVKDFKGMTFEEIEAKFAEVWKQVEDFIPMGSKEETERLKRKGLNLEQEQVKKQKSSEEAPEIETSTEEFTKEKMKEMMQRNIKFRGGLLGIKYTKHSHCQVPLPVKVVATARRLKMPLPEVCTAIEEKKKKLPVKDRWQLH
nr:hypothetical protein [Tanacetum cinerariifolium]